MRMPSYLVSWLPGSPPRREGDARSTARTSSQAESFWRPLRRRAATIARPARVRIRRRKPCFLLRRRVFGWYVRLLTGMLPYGIRSRSGQAGMTMGTRPGSGGSTATAHPRAIKSRACDRSRSDPTSQRYGAHQRRSNRPHIRKSPSRTSHRATLQGPEAAGHADRLPPRYPTACGQPVERCEDGC